MKLLRLLGLLSLVLLLASAAAPGAATSSSAYHWPLEPFDRQHPVRGAFGDPRTMAKDERFGVTGPTRSGGYSFHSGIDIVAKPGTPVYPVTSGEVVLVRRHEIVVKSSGPRERAFSYWHLLGNVRLGQDVIAEQTVLGWIETPLNHVHLSEIDKGRDVNPLARGHLEPYRDETTPRALALDVTKGRHPHLTQGGLLVPADELAIEAVDPPAMRVPGRFAGLPQTPALVEWRIRTDGHAWRSWHVAADFRRIVPRYSFWGVYAAGTYQNSPVFNRRLFQRTPGRYLFKIRLDPSQLRPGGYELEARVSDIRGNSSTRIWPLHIARA